jgi:hypothetical protein
MSGFIRSFFKYIPWEIEKDVNWALAVTLATQAEMDGRGIDGALADLLSNSDEVFTDIKYRPLAVELLTLLRNTLASHAETLGVGPGKSDINAGVAR